MATPFNPFGQGRGISQAGLADGGGRGRGASSARGSTFHPRGARGRRATKWRGTGQGVGRGRGAGAGAGDTTGATRSTTSGTTHQPASTNSPFARLHQQKPSTDLFSSQQTQAASPFSGMANARASRGARGAARGASRQNIQNQPLSAPAGQGLMQAVPVEDASILASYHERYEQLKVDRAQQRQKAIRDGLMADPNQPTSLNQAITPVGTCTSMCPEFERVERIVQKMVDKSEKYLHPSTNTLQNMETKMLKRFRRSAAGYDEQLPSDIRTPKTLLQSMNYLIRHVINGNEPLGVIHKFVWDRTRSIRNDFSVQQLTQAEDVKMAVTCLERIARFHIVSLHLLSSPANEEPFDRHQEREQLNNTMLSLMYYYDDNRGRIDFPNEAEFRAYYIIFSIHDQRPDLEARVQKWPASLLNSPRVQVALDLYAAACNTWEYQGTLDSRRPNAIAQGFYTRFFNIINSHSVSYLMACVAEIYFNHVRQTAIRAIWKGYCRQPASQQHKNEEWTVEELTRVLHFDDDEQTIKFCDEQDLELAENANGQLYLNWGSRPVDSVAFQPSSEHAYSDRYVENKRAGRTLVAVILGMTIREAATMGLIDPSSLRTRVKTIPAVPAPQDNDLFVDAQDNQIPEPVVDMTSPSLDGHQDSDAPASEVQQPSQHPPPSAPINPFATAQPPQPTMPPAEQPLNPFQTTKHPNPFASLSSGAVVQTTTPATTPFVPNSFAPSPSPFSTSKPDAVSKEETLTAAPVAAQPPSLSSTGGFATATPAPATVKPNPFASLFSGAAASSITPATAAQTSSPFAAPVSNAPSPFAPSPFPFSISKPDTLPKEGTPATAAPSATQATSLFSTDGFAAATPAPAAAKPNPFAASSASFMQPKAPAPEQAQEIPTSTARQPSSLFSGGGLSRSTSAPFTTNMSPFAAASTPFAVQKPAEPCQGIISQQRTSLSPTAKPFFASAGPEESQSVTESTVTQTRSTSQPSFASSAPAPLSSNPSQVSPVSPPREAESTTPAGSPELVPTEVSKAQDSALPTQPLPAATTPTAAAKRVNPYDPYDNPEERKAAWEKFIARRKSEVLAEEQARALAKEQAKRKRTLEESTAAETAKEEPDPKAAKVSETMETPSARRSLLLKYLEEIPELPILKRTRELLEKKPPTEEEIEAAKPKPSLIDQDELRLNRARILAEQLRSGPSLLDRDMMEGVRRMHERDARYQRLCDRLGYLADKYRNKFDSIMSGSASTSRSYSHSISPPSHGYKVAYAPDPPPGGSLSRAEERIRRTGARGLAYKPLKFPEKKDEPSKKRKESFTQTEEDDDQDERRKRRRDSSTQTD